MWRGVSAAGSRLSSQTLSAATLRKGGPARVRGREARRWPGVHPEPAHGAVTVSGAGFGDTPVTLTTVTWGNWAKSKDLSAHYL